jgi:amino acid adenylation domain-containing protein
MDTAVNTKSINTAIDKRSVEDLYPLSPMQQGILFHTLYAPASGLYVEQMSCLLRGPLDIHAFKRAWQRVGERHSVLRTAIVGEGLKEPAQIVLRKVELPLEQHDWRAYPAAEQETRLEAFLKADRVRGFNLSRAPLSRLSLMRIADDAFFFIWTFHHIVLDGLSLPQLFQEVFSFYATFHRGEDLFLDMPSPFRNYIAWLRHQRLAEAEPFWRRTLEGFVAPTPLPVDRPPDGAAYQEARYDTRLSAEATAALVAFARQHHMTVSTLVEAAWGLLLSRYSGGRDIVFGVTVSGRPADLADIETMIGMFVNTVPMRVRVPAETPLLAWLGEIHALQIEMQQYEYSSLIDIQRWSEVPRGVPLFENILVFHGNLLDDSFWQQSGEIAVSKVRFIEAVNYPLVVDVIQGADLSLSVLFNALRFDGATVARLLEHFKFLLERMVAEPEQRLADIPPLPAEERACLAGWNATAAPFPLERCFVELFAAQVARTPDSVGAACEDSQLTYAQLEQRARQLAAQLRGQGVGTERLVAVLAERSLEFLTAVLAIFMADGAYLPLDPRFPAQRLRLLLEQSGSAWALCAESLRPLLAEALAGLPAEARPAVLPLVPAGEAAVAAASSQRTPGQLAYVIYTSGSTGVPKGAMIEQHGMLNHLYAKIHDLHLTASDRVAQTAPQSFDISVWQFLAALLVGGCVEILRDEVAFDPTRLLDVVSGRQVTVVETVPSLLQAVLTALEHSPDDRLELLALRWLMPTGEALPPDLARRWLSHYPHVALINAYGPTECSDDVAHYSFSQPPAAQAERVPIGKPVANMQLYVLDAQLRLAPLGVAGELYVGGVGVGRGYLHAPDKTAQMFIPNPFATEDGGWRMEDRGLPFTILYPPSSRLYRTGDLALWRPDGRLEYLGRIDQQVKLRGFRIELGEIEAALRQHPSIRDAAVLAHEDMTGDKRLVAYLVPTNDQRPTTNDQRQRDKETRRQGDSDYATHNMHYETPSSILHPPSSILGELRAFLQQQLPAYMIPSAFVPLDALPLLSNGKLDRRALLALKGTLPVLADTFVLPRTPIEETLAQIWKHVLGLESVGVHDDFFELGGHSLLVTQVILRVRQTYHVELPLSILFEARTVASLAQSIETIQRIRRDAQVAAVDGPHEEWDL